MSLPALLNLKDAPTQSPFDKLSDDALAQVLASDIENDPVGACRIIDNFCRARKCSDDFWMNVAAKLGVQDVVDSKMANNWTWRDTIGWWCEVLRYDTVQERFYAAAKYGYIDFMRHIAGADWIAVGYVERVKGEPISSSRRFTENAYYTAMCIAASWGRVEALDWLKARWQILYGTTLDSRGEFTSSPTLISYGITNSVGYSGDVATLEWCIRNGWEDVGEAAWGVGQSGSIDAVNWVLGRHVAGWKDVISGAAVTGAMEVLDYMMSKKQSIRDKAGIVYDAVWDDAWLHGARNNAAQNGQIEVLEYVKSAYPYKYDRSYWKEVFLEASRVGRKDVMMHAYGLMERSTETLERAAKDLKYLTKARVFRFKEKPDLKFLKSAMSTWESRRKQAKEASVWLKAAMVIYKLENMPLK